MTNIFNWKLKFKISPIVFFIFSTALFFSCNKKTANIISANPNPEVQQERIDSLPTKTVETFEEAIELEAKTPPTILIPEIYLMASLEKTECYGNCPTFEFKIYSDGKARFHGKKYVNRFGEFVANLDESMILKIKAKGDELGILNLEDVYPINKVFINDIPMTSVLYNNGLSQKVIRNNFDAPKALLEFERFLLEIIETVEWKRAEGP